MCPQKLIALYMNWTMDMDENIQRRPCHAKLTTEVLTAGMDRFIVLWSCRVMSCYVFLASAFRALGFTFARSTTPGAAPQLSCRPGCDLSRALTIAVVIPPGSGDSAALEGMSLLYGQMQTLPA